MADAAMDLCDLLDDGLEQRGLVIEIDVQRPLGDAGGLGDFPHARRVEPQCHEHPPGAVQNLAALRGILVGRGDFERGGGCHRITGLSWVSGYLSPGSCRLKAP